MPMYREQSLDAFGDTQNHFEFEYEIVATSDVHTCEFLGGSLRISKLDLSSSMSEDRRAEVKAALTGDIILS